MTTPHPDYDYAYIDMFTQRATINRSLRHGEHSPVHPYLHPAACDDLGTGQLDPELPILVQSNDWGFRAITIADPIASFWLGYYPTAAEAQRAARHVWHVPNPAAIDQNIVWARNDRAARAYLLTGDLDFERDDPEGFLSDMRVIARGWGLDPTGRLEREIQQCQAALAILGEQP